MMKKRTVMGKIIAFTFLKSTYFVYVLNDTSTFYYLLIEFILTTSVYDFICSLAFSARFFLILYI
jgi:hypothetical protein